MANEQEVQRKNAEGLAAYQAGKYEEAVKLFNDAINLNPYYPATWLNRSEAYRKLGKTAEADADRNKWLILKQGEKEPVIVSATGRVHIDGQEKPVTVGGEKPITTSETPPERVDLWGPGVLLGVAFFGGWIAAGIISALNWKKMGKPDFIWPTILASIVITAAVLFVPWPVEEYIAWIIGNVICLGAAWAIWRWQRSYYEERSSGFGASLLVPVITVIAFNAVAFGLSFGLAPGTEKADWVLVEIPDENISVNLPETWNTVDVEQTGIILYAIDPVAYSTSNRYPGSFSVLKRELNLQVTLDDIELFEVQLSENDSDILKPIVHQRVQLQVGDAIQWRYQINMSRGGQDEIMEFLVYEFLRGTNLYYLTFETYPDQTDKYIPIYEEIANSFKFLN